MQVFHSETLLIISKISIIINRGSGLPFYTINTINFINGSVCFNNVNFQAEIANEQKKEEKVEFIII